MKSGLFALAFMTLGLSVSGFAASRAVHLPSTWNETGGTASPYTVVAVNLIPGDVPKLELWSKQRSICLITKADADRMGANLLDLVRLLAPKNTAELVDVTCQYPANDPYGAAVFKNLVFM